MSPRTGSDRHGRRFISGHADFPSQQEVVREPGVLHLHMAGSAADVVGDDGIQRPARRYVVAPSTAGDHTCSGVLDRLKPLHQSISNTIHETVAVVQAC